MSSNFDPNLLNAKPVARGPKPERVFMQVTSYETPAEGFHYALGHRIGRPDEQVKVRLNTVAERVQDNPKDSEERVRQLYSTGENPRETISDKAKSGVHWLSFDSARRLGDADGVVEYRAHWPKTMAKNPSAEVRSGVAHVRLRPEVKGPNPRAGQAYVELLGEARRVEPATVRETLATALAITDAAGRARDPLALIRVSHEGDVKATFRLYPVSEATAVFDQNLGSTKQVRRRQGPERTLASLLEGTAGKDSFADQQLDPVRAVVAGLLNEPVPTLNTRDPKQQAYYTNLYNGARQGALTVDVIAAEKIDFGADSRKTYVADRAAPHLKAFTHRAVEGTNVRETPAYTESVIAVLRYEDGEPYAIFASPAEQFPTSKKLDDVTVDAINAATREQEREQLHEESETPELA